MFAFLRILNTHTHHSKSSRKIGESLAHFLMKYIKIYTLYTKTNSNQLKNNSKKCAHTLFTHSKTNMYLLEFREKNQGTILYLSKINPYLTHIFTPSISFIYPSNYPHHPPINPYHTLTKFTPNFQLLSLKFYSSTYIPIFSLYLPLNYSQISY